MTPAGRPGAVSDGEDTAGTSLPEHVLDALVPLLHPHQPEPEVDGEVAYDGRGVLVLDHDLDLAVAGGTRGQPGPDQRLTEQLLRVGLPLHLDDQAAGRVQELRGRRRPE